MVRIVEIGLLGAVVLATLAFGGTEVPYFPLVQIVLFALGLSLLVTYRPALEGQLKLPVGVPLLLVAMILLQIAPLPRPMVGLFYHTAAQFGDASYVRISTDPYETTFNFAILLSYLAAFYLTLFVCRHRNGRRHIIFTLLVLGTFEACYGLVQYLIAWQQSRIYGGGGVLEGATGTYINHDHFAGLLEMILPFASALAYYQFEKISQSQAGISDRIRDVFKHEEFHKLLLWPFLTILLFVALVFSKSRMGIMSAVVSVALLSALSATSILRRTRAVALVAILCISAAFAMIVWIGAEPVIDRFQTLGQEYASGDSRLTIWQDTLHLIRQRPWFGSGLGTFPIVYPSVQTAFVSRFVSHAHNDYLELISDMGLPIGLGLIGAFFYLLLQTARRITIIQSRFERAATLGCFGALIAISLHSVADFNLHIPANGLLFAVIVGLSSGAPLQVSRRSPSVYAGARVLP